MSVYKVSYVVIGSDHPGGIANADHRPKVGERVRIGDQTFVIIEVFELMPSRGDFYYIHATCRPIPDEDENQVLNSA